MDAYFMCELLPERVLLHALGCCLFPSNAQTQVMKGSQNEAKLFLEKFRYGITLNTLDNL
jgi:hypothetical protein